MLESERSRRQRSALKLLLAPVVLTRRVYVFGAVWLGSIFVACERKTRPPTAEPQGARLLTSSRAG